MIRQTSKELYAAYRESMRKIADIRYASAVLQWDQETYLPPKGAPIRGQQISTLSETAHQLFTAEELGVLLQELKTRGDLTDKEKKNIALSWEDYERQKKIPSAFVRELSETVNKSFHSWILARKKNSFAQFSPELARLVALKKQEAEYLGYSEHPYNALLDEFDKGSTVNKLDKVFGDIRTPLKELLDKIMAKPQVDDSFLHQHFPKDKQWAFGLDILRQLGYDMEAGRQDISEHPFTINFNSNDVRITTRIDEDDFSAMTWSCIHEAGHALYEQGLPDDEYGLPCGEAASLTIHESQSRLWENHVGRSEAFCVFQFPLLQQYFPEQFRGLSATDVYKGINKVQPSLIRTEADELTYHFHVMIRFDIEKALIEGSLQTADIPAFWNEHYARYLNVSVPDDKRGCLQDIHWSHGSFGYFPTYSLGSFCAAQLFDAAQQSVPALENELDNGRYQPLLQWLRNNLHQHGRRYNSNELMVRITGREPGIDNFYNRLLDKYKNIYNI
ncbi:MAG: carboxypeptidase M32 [Chitinophagaceae bacterium]|nr:carboxypeptidase M32 [Chitinophagaceae bacterium]